MGKNWNLARIKNGPKPVSLRSISRALAVPLLLLGVEDGLQAARVEVYEDLVGIDGLLPAVLALERRFDSFVGGPVRNERPDMHEKNMQSGEGRESIDVGS